MTHIVVVILVSFLFKIKINKEKIYMEKLVVSKFPSAESYNSYLLKIRWKENYKCVFCNSQRITRIKSTFKFHCNSCNTNFSLTSKTIMHRTKLDLRKWLVALYEYIVNINLSYRRLSKIINVNKKTAYLILNKIEKFFYEQKMNIVYFMGLDKNFIEILSLILTLSI